jgi:hypothetical protein
MLNTETENVYVDKIVMETGTMNVNELLTE